MSAGTFENPLKVGTEELEEVMLHNLTGEFQSAITSTMGKGFDEGFSDQQIFEAFKNGAIKALTWLERS